MTPNAFSDGQRYALLEAMPRKTESCEAFIGALRDESWSIRQLAAERLTGLPLDTRACAQLIDLLKSRENPGARNAAAWVLARTGREGVTAVVPLLSDVDSDLRKFATDILGDAGHLDGLPACLVALNDSDENVRLAAIEAIGKIGGAQAIQALLRVLSSDSPLERVAALEGLTALQVGAPLPVISAMAADPLTARTAMRAAAMLPQNAGQPLLNHALLNRRTRDAALAALGAIAPGQTNLNDELREVLALISDASSWLTATLSGDDEPRLRGALRLAEATRAVSLARPLCRLLAHPTLAEATLRTLVRLGPDAATALLNAAHLQALDETTQLLVGDLIAELADARHIGALAPLASHAESSLALLALRALGNTRSPEAIVPLMKALRGEHARAAAGALTTLGRARPAEVKTALLGELSAQPSAAFLSVLASVAPDQAAPIILQYARHPDAAVRQCSVELSATDGVQTLSLLRGALLDEQANVREAVCRVANSVGTAEASALLLQSLHDPSQRVVCAAISMLGRLRVASAREPLFSLLNRAEPAVLVSTLQALERLGEFAVELPEALFTHPEGEVVKQALRLCSLGVRPRPRLRKALLDARWSVRAAAAQWLALAGQGEDLAALELALAEETNDLAQKALRQALSQLKAFAPHAP